MWSSTSILYLIIMGFTIWQSILLIMKMPIERFLTLGTDKMLQENNNVVIFTKAEILISRTSIKHQYSFAARFG